MFLARSEAVAKCKAEINSILMDEESKEELDCPAGIVGRIIGRGGETIRALQSASQVGVAPGRAGGGQPRPQWHQQGNANALGNNRRGGQSAGTGHRQGPAKSLCFLQPALASR